MKRLRSVVTLGAVAAALAAGAQPSTNAPTPPVTGSAPLRYPSAFANYRPYQDVEVGNWKALNEQVRASAAARSMPTLPAPEVHSKPPASASTPRPHSDHGGRK